MRPYNRGMNKSKIRRLFFGAAFLLSSVLTGCLPQGKTSEPASESGSFEEVRSSKNEDLEVSVLADSDIKPDDSDLLNLNITVTNLSDHNININPQNFTVIYSGSRTASVMNETDTKDQKSLKESILAPGQSVTGKLKFLIKDGSADFLEYTAPNTETVRVDLMSSDQNS